jgi:hypothetical protein
LAPEAIDLESLICANDVAEQELSVVISALNGTVTIARFVD